MPETEDIRAAVERLTRAIDECRAAEARAEARSRSADATIADAQARMTDADAQTRHAETAMAAAKAHMLAARSQMQEADSRAAATSQQQDLVAQQQAEADRQSTHAMDDMDRYQRALYHYMQLVRQRIANPLQIILGMAQALLTDTTLDDATRREMLETIEAQARVLERISLFYPTIDRPEEEGLDPRP